MKEKIGRMFHLNAPGERREGSSESFEPVDLFSKAKKAGTKRKASESRGKSGPVKKKVKQMKLKITVLPKMSKHTPTGTYREQLMHHVDEYGCI